MEQEKNNDHRVWSALSLLAEHIYSRFLWSVHTGNGSTSTMKCQLGSGSCRLGAWVLKTLSAVAVHWKSTFEDVRAVMEL